MTTKNFGEYFKELRLKTGNTLREYCRIFEEDPAFISRLERGKISPPLQKEKLKRLALSVELKPETEKWNNFFDLARLSAGRLPDEVMSDENVIAHLPVFLRTIEGKGLTDEQFDTLVTMIKSF